MSKKRRIGCLKTRRPKRQETPPKRTRRESWPTCRHPDRDAPGTICGYPLPCPYHTATIDYTREPAELRIPLPGTRAIRARQRLAEIGAALDEETVDVVVRSRSGRKKR